jgi:hypothetical protein
MGSFALVRLLLKEVLARRGDDMRLRKATLWIIGLLVIVSMPVLAEDVSGRGVASTSLELPSFGLSDSIPSVLNPGGEIGYVIPQTAGVMLEVFDIMGVRVALLADSVQTAGHHSLSWSGAGTDGKQLANGVYFYRLRTGDLSDIRKVLIIR